MGHHYDEVVHVRAQGGDCEPSAFLWRDRLHVVRDVLDHWSERTPWWDGPAARALRGEGAGVAPGTPLAVDAEVWRVVASRGRAAGTGTYELRRDPAGAVPGAPADGSWRLLRVVD